MDAALLTTLLRRRNIENITPTIDKIKEYEQLVAGAEKELAQLQGVLDHLKQKHVNGIVISWRDEIRESLWDEKRNYRLITHNEIVKHIEDIYYLKADRRIKNTLVTTLSKMCAEKEEINRVEYQGEYYYGYKEMFSSDGKLKPEYKHLLR